MNETRSIVILGAGVRVESTEDNQVVLSFPTRQLTPEEHAMLDSLFPNTEKLIGRALSLETLMNALKQ